MFKPIVRYRAQLLFRRSYKPGRTAVLRLRPRAPIAPRSHPPALHPACAPEGAWSFPQAE
ncbi:MAG: hypothetical protein KIT22_09240 [Verrucomicrobiae bacterium]|nr:hypothetical protein [Verrucomicrobiae bacterium]